MSQVLSSATLAGTSELVFPVAGPQVSVEPFYPTSEQIQAEIEDAMSRELSPAFLTWVDLYSTVGRRNAYLWKWCRHAVRVTTLPCVLPELREELCDTKTLGVLLDVLLDDLADQRGDDGLLEELLQVMDYGKQPELARFSAQQQRYAQVTIQVWNEILRRAESLPRHSEFRDLLRFDYLQLSNVMRYSYLLNSQLELLNLVEHDAFTPHNMHIMICSTFDLMASPSFDRTEVGRLREAIWNAQWMGRIGNLATTWQRELGERDFTSGVYARAVALGDLTVEDLRQGNRQRIETAIQAGGHEEFYWQKWQQHRAALLSEHCRLRSFDTRAIVAGLQRLICLHQGSRGRK